MIFTLNATHALNLALRGLLRPGDRVVTSGMEHNAVMRPLRALEAGGAGGRGPLRVRRHARRWRALAAALRRRHAAGGAQPRQQRRRHHRSRGRNRRPGPRGGALLLVDAAQTAGVLPIDMEAHGHRPAGLHRAQGACRARPAPAGWSSANALTRRSCSPLMRGGTGSRSEFEEQPDDLPDKFESGTPNGVGIAGLGAGLAWIQERGLNELRAHELELSACLREGLGNIQGLHLYGPGNPQLSTTVISFTLAGKRVSEIGYRLDEEDEILCRVGLHCAPAAHRSIGTFSEGTVRLAPGPFNHAG